MKKLSYHNFQKFHKEMSSLERKYLAKTSGYKYLLSYCMLYYLHNYNNSKLKCKQLMFSKVTGLYLNQKIVNPYPIKITEKNDVSTVELLYVTCNFCRKLSNESCMWKVTHRHYKKWGLRMDYKMLGSHILRAALMFKK